MLDRNQDRTGKIAFWVFVALVLVGALVFGIYFSPTNDAKPDCWHQQVFGSKTGC